MEKPQLLRAHVVWAPSAPRLVARSLGLPPLPNASACPRRVTMVAAGMVAAEVVAADMVAAELVDAEMVAAEMVAAEMVSAGLPCNHSSFAAALPSLPFWLIVLHPSGSVTHPRPLAPLHAGRLLVCLGSAAHGPLRPQRGSSPLQLTRPGISSRVCQTSASCGSLQAS
ncbi:unnamed protein product [Closterium sp. NIES-54]